MRSSSMNWSKMLRRASLYGLFAGTTGLALWYGCAGTNTDYVPVNSDAGMDSGVSYTPDLLGCVPGPNEDVPDDMLLDTNCDGIDGDINRAIFADAVHGSDNNLGSPESPVQTIAKALSLVAAANQAAGQQVKDSVYVSKGTYAESVTLAPGINIYGGYDASQNWKRAINNTLVVINGGATAVSATNIILETHLETVTVNSAKGVNPGDSSYGLFALNSAGPLVLKHDRITAGDGANGANGSSGTTPTNPANLNGGNGDNGCNGCSGSPTNDTDGAGGAGGGSACGVTGGSGGLAGYNSNGTSGSPGTNNPNSGGGGGSNGGSIICFSSSSSGGGKGGDGTTGGNGTNGAAAANMGSVGIVGYQPANGGGGVKAGNGSAGGGGGGGGGGTGSPCNADRGGGGGGGGGGGCAAPAGGGGGGGGASVGIYAYGTTVLQITDTDIASGNGGNGGNGGNSALGSVGGVGGMPGNGADDSSAGGPGGKGGNGGVSGAGSGGLGGPTVGLWMVSNAQVTGFDPNRISVNGSAGTGGMAGVTAAPLSSAFPGSNGISSKTRTN